VNRYPDLLNRPYLNRELSWVEFNRRVLFQALDRDKPLLERLKFIAIVASNFDEFFMVRVASVKRQYDDGNYTTCPSGLSPAAQLTELRIRIKDIISKQYECLTEEILPGLVSSGIVYHTSGAFTEMHRLYLQKYFRSELQPLLSPLRFEPDMAYINFQNLSLHVAFKLRLQQADGEETEKEKDKVAIVQLPRGLNRIVYLPEVQDVLGFTFLENILIEFASELFPGYEVLENMVFRVARDADFAVEEGAGDGFLEAMEEVVQNRDRSQVVFLMVGDTSSFLRETLQAHLKLETDNIFRLPLPLDLAGFMEISSAKGFDHLRDQPWKPVDSKFFPENESILDAISKGDKLLSLPYESFAPVVRMVREAANDPSVLAIKMTLYRTSGDSPIVRALEDAARNGKHVTVLVELKARFDEQRNITWAERLSEAGVIVVYGIVGLKVHAKALLVVRREEAGIKRYLHLSTGNYNDRTAKIYSDLCLFTCREDFTYEAGLFFNAITGYSAIPVMQKLSMAPNALKPKLLQLIEREAQKSGPDTPGFIIAKMNALVDIDVMDALYAASKANVQVVLNIRGVCMLVPGVPRLSENIRVLSIVDRYLEHTRAFWFQNGGQNEVYLSSADWMPRNLEGRVELLFPVEDVVHKELIRSMLDIYMRDNVQSWDLSPDGTYRKNLPIGERLSAQERLYTQTVKRNAERNREDKKEFNVRRTPPKPGPYS